MAEERTPERHSQRAARIGNGSNGAPASHADPIPEVVRLLPANNAAPWELARVALGGPRPDEIVPTAEGYTFFEGELAAQFEAEGQKDALLKARLDRAKRRPK